MNLKLPPPKGLNQEEFNRQVLEALAAIKRAVDASEGRLDTIEARLLAAGIP